MTDTMRALVFLGPWELAVQQRAIRAPGEGEVRLQVLATGICGSDLHGFTGHTGRRHPDQVMGHETVGRVVELGPGVSQDLAGKIAAPNPALTCGTCAMCRVGDEELCETLKVLGVAPEIDAAYAEFITVPATNLVELPASIDPMLGALVEPLAVGYHALRRGGAKPTDTLLVLGGGPIGQALVLAAQRFGITQVLVSEPDPHRSGLVRRLGAAVTNPTNLVQDVEGVLGGQPSLVVDAVGVSATVQTALTSCRRGGTVVLVGMGQPALEISAYEVSVAERTIVGTFCYSAEDFRSTAHWVATTPVDLSILIDGVEPLEHGPAVFMSLARQEREASKILLSPTMV